MGVGRKGTGQESCDANATPLFAVRLVFEAVLAIHRQHVITEDVVPARVLGPSISVFREQLRQSLGDMLACVLFSHILSMSKGVLRKNQWCRRIAFFVVIMCCQTFLPECCVWQRVSTGGECAIRDRYLFLIYPESGRKSLDFD